MRLAGTPHNTIESVHPASAITSTGDQIFYRGDVDDKVHMYYLSSGLWNHTVLNPSTASNENVDGDIKVLYNQHLNNNIVFFRTSGGKISYYIRQGSNASPWYFGTVGSYSSLPSNEQAVGKILPVEFNGEIYCFYIGADGYVQYYKTSGIAPGILNPAWHHGWLGRWHQSEAATVNSSLDFDDGILYYYGEDGSSHRYAHRFYWDGSDWRDMLL